MRFTSGDVPGQSKTFAPSIAEFVEQARFLAPIIQDRGRPKLTGPTRERYVEPTPESRRRMVFKMSVLSEAFRRKQVDRVAEAIGLRNGQSTITNIEGLIALAQEWELPVPEELFKAA